MKKNPHWPHAPMHCLSGRGTYIVTAGTYKKEHFFRGPNRLGVLHRGLLAVAHEFGWQLKAWAVFSNHYHFVGHSPEDNDDAGQMILTKLTGGRSGITSGKQN